MSVELEPKLKTSEKSSKNSWLTGQTLAIAGILAVVLLASSVLLPGSPVRKLVFGTASPELQHQPQSFAGSDLAGTGTPSESGHERLVSQVGNENPAAANEAGSSDGQVNASASDEPQPFDSAMTAQQMLEANVIAIRELQASSSATDRRILGLMDRLDEVSSEIGKLRLEIADLKQFDRSQNERLRELERVQGQLGEVAAEFNKFVDSELPALRRELGTRTETQATLPSQSQSPADQEETGTLVLDNQTERTIEIMVNGKPELLKPGRNSFEVSQGQVRVEGEGRSWLLDAGLWQTYKGRKVMYRDKWPL